MGSEVRRGARGDSASWLELVERIGDGNGSLRFRIGESRNFLGTSECPIGEMSNGMIRVAVRAFSSESRPPQGVIRSLVWAQPETLHLKPKVQSRARFNPGGENS